MKLRRATLADAREITDLVNYWFRTTGDVLPRTLDSVCESIRSWVVVEDEEGIAGCGALVVLGPELAEVRSVVVRPGRQGNGAGRTIVQQLLADAEEIRVPTVFTLTKTTGFFEKLGFQVTEMERFPRKVWKDCIHCAKFPECDEVAMVLDKKGAADELVSQAMSVAAG
ncbi:MAG: N-acetyltransferase [Anaerolineae bacterium]